MITLGKSDRILITGGSGLVGKALNAILSKEGFQNIISIGIVCNSKGSNDNDECSEYAVIYYFTFNGKKLLYKNIFLAG